MVLHPEQMEGMDAAVLADLLDPDRTFNWCLSDGKFIKYTQAQIDWVNLEKREGKPNTSDHLMRVMKARNKPTPRAK